MSIDDVVAEVRSHHCDLVEVTGGEPLLQGDVHPLMERLSVEGFQVLLETGGHMPIDDVPDAVTTIVDVKCPASGESEKMHWPNLDQLSRQDEVKFVIEDRGDFDYAREVVTRFQLADRVAAVLFSPVHGVLAPQDLAEWILEDHVPARLHLQAHKYIWAPDRRGV